MDGPALVDYEKIPAGGTPLAAIKAMGRSRAAIEFGRTLPSPRAAEAAGETLRRHLGTALGMPIGIRETDRFFEVLEALSGKSLADQTRA